MTNCTPVGATTQQSASYIRPNEFETVTAWLHGRVSAPPHNPRDNQQFPRRAFENAIMPAVASAPCFVAFSGGRDSSAVLAVATELARREGLPDPIPVTEVYPAVPESDESAWQHLVLDHLDLHEWLRIELVEGNDYLNPHASESLKTRGLIWPPALHAKPAILSRLGSGSLLTGEGGDEVLGRRRGAQVSRLWRRGKRPDVTALRSAAGALAPEPIRRRRVLASLNESTMQPWISAEVRMRHHRLLAADWASEPLGTARSLEWLLARRSAAAASHNYGTLAAEFGLALREPFLDPSFVRSFARHTGRWGFASRTEAMRVLFGDLLPDAIVTRRSKAYFNRAFMGAATRSFARTWDGAGVDPELVDCDVLRAEWLSDMPSAISSLLLQAAWLGSNRPSVIPHRQKS